MRRRKKKKINLKNLNNTTVGWVVLEVRVGDSSKERRGFPRRGETQLPGIGDNESGKN